MGDGWNAPGGLPELPPDVALPAAAYPAWHAYRAMQASKEAHFAALAEAHAARSSAAPRLAQAAHREQLLAAHDDAVKAFARAMQALAGRDAEAHRELVAIIARLNAAVGGPSGD